MPRMWREKVRVMQLELAEQVRESCWCISLLTNAGSCQQVAWNPLRWECLYHGHSKHHIPGLSPFPFLFSGAPVVKHSSTLSWKDQRFHLLTTSVLFHGFSYFPHAVHWGTSEQNQGAADLYWTHMQRKGMYVYDILTKMDYIIPICKQLVLYT